MTRPSLLMVAAPFGLGPAAKAWLLATKLAASHDVTICVNGDAARFLRRSLPESIAVVDARFEAAFPDRATLDRFDGFISINQVLALWRLAKLGLTHRAILVDSLAAWRRDIEGIPVPPGLLAHFVQDYPTATGPISADLAPGVEAVAPIVWDGPVEPPPGTDGAILLHMGGMAGGLGAEDRAIDAVGRFTSQVVSACRAWGRPLALLGNAHAIAAAQAGSDAILLPEASPAQAGSAVAAAEVLVTTPGIGTVFEALHHRTPIVLLPPANSSQAYHYLVLTELGVTGTLSDHTRNSMAAMLATRHRESHRDALIAGIASGAPGILSGLAPALGRYLDPHGMADRSATANNGKSIIAGLASRQAADAIVDALGTPGSGYAPQSPAQAAGDTAGSRTRALASFVGQLPKVELHLHLEGALPPDFVLHLARRNGIPLPFKRAADFFQPQPFADFGAFARRLLFVSGCLRTPIDFEEAVSVLGHELARTHVRHAEVMWTPQLYLNRGIPLGEILNAMNRGRKAVGQNEGIGLRWIVDLVRSYPQPARRIAQWACSPAVRAAGVVAIGLGGPEEGYPAAQFADCFALARSAGLGSNPHAGENAGAGSVSEVLDLLSPDRIAHGVRATEDPAVMARIGRERVVLDVCPTSNVLMGVRPDYASLRLPDLINAGCRITINTDDPVLFGTDLNREYLAAMEHGGLDPASIGQCIANAVDAARLPDDVRERLRSNVMPTVHDLVANYAG